MRRIRVLSIFFIAATVALLPFGSISAVEKPRQGNDTLFDTYQRIKPKLDATGLGVPLYLESSDLDGRVHVDVYGIFDYRFDNILNALTVPVNWCDIVALHPNIKACTFRKLADTWQLTFYLGRKVYQAPEDVYQLIYHYRNIEQKKGYLNIVLSADEGPFGTKNHLMRLEAMPLSEERTFVRVGYAYNYGLPLRFAENIYFATLGRGKEGFTVTGTDSNGDPVYIGGPRGAVERNAVRYYFAIQSFLDALRYPEESRFKMRIGVWYDLTMRYRRQLFEMEKKDYLTFKTEEHKNQTRLQRQISESLQ